MISENKNATYYILETDSVKLPYLSRIDKLSYVISSLIYLIGVDLRRYRKPEIIHVKLEVVYSDNTTKILETTTEDLELDHFGPFDLDLKKGKFYKWFNNLPDSSVKYIRFKLEIATFQSMYKNCIIYVKR